MIWDLGLFRFGIWDCGFRIVSAWRTGHRAERQVYLQFPNYLSVRYALCAMRFASGNTQHVTRNPEPGTRKPKPKI
jgi:hypothetical protein